MVARGERPSPPASSTATLHGWGRLAVPGREILAEDLARVTRDVPLTRGLGRSYGDSSLPPPDRPVVASSRLADRILGFSPSSGALHAEAGLSLRALNRLFLHRGFTSPVLTGTQDVTLGGMVAADVHGKNHHRSGSFGRHVRRLRLRLADGRLLDCSRDEEPDLFRATLGGMGLTGHVLEVEVVLERIPSPWIYAESERIDGIEPFLAGLAAAAGEWPFTVGWIDCLKLGRGLGRGILFRGRWAEPHEAPKEPPSSRRHLRVPIDFPSWALNRLSVQLFNAFYFHKHRPRLRRAVVHPESFFHPLDAIDDWNRIYGRRGLTQHQCVLPATGGAETVAAFLELLARSRAASFLAVIKDCGAEGEGMLSFPRPGTSIALDLPVRDGTRDLIDRLNAFVIEHGGRVYLAKDAFTRAEDFRAMEGDRLAAFQAVRDRWDPERRLRSAQSVRLFGDPS